MQHGLATAALTNSQLEFISEDQLITISPKFTMGQLTLISGDFGPFRPQVPIAVPLWLAVTLKKRELCSILCPEWLTVDNLENIRHAEREDKAFQKLPFCYMEIASQLISCAPDDIEDSAKIQSLLEDIWVARFSKTRKGLEGMEIQTLFALRWNNLTGLEVNHLRQFLGPAIDHFHRLLGEAPEEGESSNASSGSLFSTSQRQSDSSSTEGSIDPPPRKLRRR